MPIKFQKPQQKFKKNLTKEFQTFNNKPEQMSDHSPKYESDVVKKSNLSEHKPPKATANHQMTTQAKSPLIKSASGSKSHLAPYHKPQSVSNQPSKNKSLKSSKKSLHQSLSKLRPLTPADQLARSRQSSPQAQRVYSKMSSYDKRAFSKLSNYKKPQLPNTNDHQATYGAKSSSKVNVSKTEKQKKAQSSKIKQANLEQLNEKQVTKVKKQTLKKLQSENFQISFPQMITESQSAYPSSSYPNTGKQSQHQGLEDWQRKRNSNITQEQQNQIEEPIDEDYISEEQLQDEQVAESSEPSNIMCESGAPSNQNNYPSSSGYNQLPKSYLIAMEILQAKVVEQQATIKKLKQKASKQDKKYKNLEAQIQSLENVIQDQQKVISQKDAQIKFLKGYLDEEKHNNRQALKQVAKNVYQRSISVKKHTQNNLVDSSAKSIKKAKKQLFTQEENEKQNTQQKKLQSKRTSTNEAQNTKEAQNQINFNTEILEENFYEDEKTSQEIQNSEIEQKQKQKTRQQEKRQFQSKDLTKKPSKPQIKQQKVQQQHPDTKQKFLQNRKPSQNERQILLAQQKLAHEERIKDQLMREQILREQSEKKYNYLERSRKNNRSVSVKQAYPYTVKKYQNTGWDSSARKNIQDGQRQLYSEGKRIRSMSTAVKYLEEQKNPNITYRPRNPQTSSITPSFSYQGPPTSVLNPSSQSIMDPVLERYIQVKSDISSYRFQNDTAFFNNEGFDLKSDKKHRQAVSQMRELMRGEKQLVALNYRLEAIEKRILECVKSTGKDDHLVKTIKQQAEEKMLLEDLQKQYAVLKKEFERKQLSVKQLKISLDQK